ncbi:SRPBCC family protein [Acidovorax sp. SUPP1855]|nr:SRPBCC family protein [Acidovorax sp. SUPP1855]
MDALGDQHQHHIPLLMRVSVAIEIHRPIARLFWDSQDYSRRLEWDSYLAQACLLDGRTEAAVGVRSFCKSKAGSGMESRYISFEPPTHAAVQMTQGPWILSKFGGTWRFKSLAERHTEVRFIYHFQCRPAALAWLVEPLVAWFYRRDMHRRLVAFKEWTERPT